MHYYILTYETVPTYLKDRGPYRDEHLDLARQYCDSGHLLLGGALENPADKAVLIFRCGDDKIIQRFAENDPYVKNGLIKNWHIRKWNVVVGND